MNTEFSEFIEKYDDLLEKTLDKITIFEASSKKPLHYMQGYVDGQKFMVKRIKQVFLNKE